MIRASECEHLSTKQRNYIRYRIRATEQGVAAKYGVSVATVRAVRATGQPNHPARLAAIDRRWERTLGTVAEHGGNISRSVVPAAQAKQPKGQLHVEGGVDLPVPLA